MKEFGKIIYSNKSILKNKSVNFFIIFLLFFINTALVASPLFMTRAQIDSGELLDRFDGLEQAFAEIYDLGLDCDITEYATCGLPDSANGYEIIIEGEPTTERFIWFADEMIIKDELSISGSYDFLTGIKLNPMKYRENSEAILFALTASSLGRDYYIMYAGQFVQNMVYLLAISALIMVANYKQAKRKITYTEAVKVSVMAMLGPALVTAITGIFFAGFAALIFMTIYSIRMMYIYYGVLRS